MSVYQLIGEDKKSGGDLWTHLRWSSKKRRKRYGVRDRRGQIPHRRSIEKRGRKANRRKRVGHLERDLVRGKNQQGALLTIVDRKSRMAFAVRVMSKSAREIHEATLRALRPIRKIVRTVTNDNGKEFARHRRARGLTVVSSPRGCRSWLVTGQAGTQNSPFSSPPSPSSCSWFLM